MVRTLLVALAAASLLPASAAARPVAGALRVAIDTAAHDADFSRTAGRSQVVILQEWEAQRLRSLKAANPGVTVLMYKNLSALAKATNGMSGTGVSTQEAESHPEWYLRNTRGERFAFDGYDYLWAADIGNRGFQERWAANVAAKLKEQPWDGVFVDDTNPTIKYHYDVASVAKYPSDEAYSAATGSALSVIGPRLRARGALVIPNFGAWRRYRPTVSRWLKYVSGGMEEMFTKYGESPSSGYFTGVDWEDNLASLRETQAQGKLFLGISHSTRGDRAAARYGWATMMLAAEGRATFALHSDYTNETWFPEYDYDLGAPKGPATVAGGVHRRAFARGLVLVNPTGSSVQVRFGGRYRGSGLGRSSRTTMGPHSGLVLLAARARPTGARKRRAAGHKRRVARRSVRVRVLCTTSARPCRRAITVALRGRHRRVVVGRRHVVVRRTSRVKVHLSRKGRAAVTRGRRLKVVVVRARR